MQIVLESEFMELLARTKLSPNQSQVLHALFSIGEPCSQKKIIEKTGLDKTGVSKAVNSLLKSSIVVNTNNYHKKTSSIVVNTNNYRVVNTNNYQENTPCNSVVENPSKSKMNDIVSSSSFSSSSLLPLGSLDNLYYNISKKHALFDDFWKLYPRKQAKVDAQKAWKQKKCADLIRFDTILKALKKQIDTLWRDKSKDHIPLPATWLRGERWDDEVFESGDGGYTTEKMIEDWNREDERR